MMDMGNIKNQMNDFIRDGIPSLFLFLAQYGLWGLGLFLAVMGSFSAFGLIGAIATSLLEGAEIGFIYKLLRKRGHHKIPGYVQFFTWCFVIALMIFSGTEQFIYLDKSLNQSVADITILESKIESKEKYKAELKVTLAGKKTKVTNLDKDLSRKKLREIVKTIDAKGTETDIKTVDLELVGLNTELSILKKQKKSENYLSGSTNIKILIILFIKLVNIFAVSIKSYDEFSKDESSKTILPQTETVDVEEVNPSPPPYKQIEEPVYQPKPVEPQEIKEPVYQQPIKPTPPKYEHKPIAEYQAPRETRSDTTDDIIRIKAIQRYMAVENKDVQAIAKAMGNKESSVLDFLNGKKKMANRPFENFRRNCFGKGAPGIEAYDEFVKRFVKKEVNNHA